MVPLTIVATTIQASSKLDTATALSTKTGLLNLQQLNSNSKSESSSFVEVAAGNSHTSNLPTSAQ